MEIQTSRITLADEALCNLMERLLPQLSPGLSAPTVSQVRGIVHSRFSALFQASVDGSPAGIATVVLYRIPSCVRGVIEDVVVDTAHRRCGVGTALVQACLDFAFVQGADKVDLTSHPSRVAANALYRRMGFVQRETNLYRFDRSSRLASFSGSRGL